MPSEEKQEITLQGVIASPGVAHGPAFVLLQKELEVPTYSIPEERIGQELERFDLAILKTREQITKIRNEIASKLGEDEAGIFDAHLLVLEDKALLDETTRELKQHKLNIEHAFREVSNRYIEFFSNIDDTYIKERVADIRDVSKRVLNNLMGNSQDTLGKLFEEKVLVSEDLSPSETAGLDKSKVLALVTDLGSRTSHAVIMARSIEVPAVVGLHDISSRVKSGDTLLVDGYDGIVIINPSERSLFRYGRIKLKRQQLRNVFLENAALPAKTIDGKHLHVFANIEEKEDIPRLKKAGADGVGLFRTEAIFLKHDRFPTEEEQYAEYKAVVEALAPQPVTIRTLDLGGDKSIHGGLMQFDEANPFLGFRAIRFCLEHGNVFKDQLRAILRASAFGKVKIMFPMISGVSELLAAKTFLEEAKEELAEKNIDFDPNIPIGSMIEIPSAALVADALAEHCDFFSIGTNDLIQYTLAVDRGNDKVAHLYQPNHPAVLRLIKNVIDVAHEKGIHVGICGEMAGDPLYATLLFGMGADDLSTGTGILPEIKHTVRQMRFEDVQTVGKDVLSMYRSDDIEKCLADYHTKIMGDLIV